jgi:hypothetical protein
MEEEENADEESEARLLNAMRRSEALSLRFASEAYASGTEAYASHNVSLSSIRCVI